MNLIHTTLMQTVSPILGQGVRVACSRSSARRVWFHVRALKGWARKHVADRHKVDAREVVHMEFELPTHWLHRHSKGVYWCDRDVPPAHCVGVEFSPDQWGGQLA
jgi:hypothetical protein